MKITVPILITGYVILLYGCNPTSERKGSIPVEKTKAEIIPPPELIAMDNTTAEISETGYSQDCVRGQGIPILKKDIYPGTTFQLQPDSITSIETLTFENGDRLIIRNWGCEYYVLTFRFETSRFKSDTTNIPYWFKKAALLMAEVNNGIDAPIDIPLGIDTLIHHIEADASSQYQHLKLGEEIEYGASEFNDYTTVDRIEKLSENKYAIEVSFVSPL